MSQSLNRLALAFLFLLSTVATADAALINIAEVAGGGSGTLVNDGQGDVGSNNGGATGDALLMSAFGLTNGNLTNDLGLLSISGVFTDANVFGGPATSVDLSNLWLIGTLTGNPLPACATCGFLSDINVGGGLSLPNGDKQNVLFAIPIVGTIGTGVDPWVGPATRPAGDTILIPPGTVQYGLDPTQIAFIVSRMINSNLGHNFGVNDVRFGLSVEAQGVVGTSGFTDIGSGWDIQGPAPIPEPATMLLVGSGLLVAGARRLRRRTNH